MLQGPGGHAEDLGHCPKWSRELVKGFKQGGHNWIYVLKVKAGLRGGIVDGRENLGGERRGGSGWGQPCMGQGWGTGISVSLATEI